MKIAVSIPDDIIEQVERVAKEEKLSRSRVVTEALRDYVERRRNRQILKQLNRVYAEPDSAEEEKIRANRKKYYARKFQGEEW